MTQFEFFWAFYGLLLGLAVAELLSGFASLLRESAPPRLGVVTPLLGMMEGVDKEVRAPTVAVEVGH